MRKWLGFLALLVAVPAWGQDPAFSQFFSSPLNINPALTANINADWRMIANFRDQWIGPASPYVTGTISYDRKIMQHKMAGVEEGNIIGVGGMLMFDHAMAGVAKSIYGSLNLSYQLKLIDDGIYKHKLGLGFAGIFGRRYIDFARVDWEEQFVGTGFNTSLPTGEVALTNMKSYLSASTGLVYSITTEKSNFDIGASLFHFNKPKQTFMEDENQVLAMRKVVHANYERVLNERFVLNTAGIYQFQSDASYFSIGGAIGMYLHDVDNIMLNGGIWYWSDNAVIPYIGLVYKDMQFGFSYDYTISKLNAATRKPNTFELSFILRGEKGPSGIIPCPWK